MKKILSVTLALVLVLCAECFALGETAETASAAGVLPAIAGENGMTYVNLFEIILDDSCRSIWTDYCGAVVGEENADAVVDGLQASISSDLYGEAAIEAFGSSDSKKFDCWFINGLKSMTVKGNEITAEKTDGTAETHTYEYLGQYNIGEGETMVYMGQEIPMAFPCDVYKSTDEAGEFNYFFFRDDTMETTYHLEFRYGKDLQELQGYLTGPYAYWLSAAFDANADEKALNNVIALFCLENMDYSARTDASLAQVKELGLVGSWDADLTPFGDAYAGAELNMTIDENGHGITLMNGTQTADFAAYALDSGEKGDGKGLYVAYSNLEYEAEGAPFEMTVNEDGAQVLTLISDEGTISWIKKAE